MPSPFPGMDPYLESPRHWRGFHSTMIIEMNAQLNKALPPGFASFVEERVYIVVPENTAIPDIVITRQPTATIGRSGTTAVLERKIDEAETVTYFPDEVRELFIEIRTIESEQEDVIAAIELLSPTNKLPGGRGREEYDKKQRDILESPAHLVEIDLLRAGTHTVAVPRSVVLAKGPWDYLICIHAAGEGTTFRIWRNFLVSPLPKVSIPLKSGVPDVALDLQDALNQVYDRGPYQRVMNYHGEPLPLLSKEYETWTHDLLREKGYRT
jgi:hypothetical protein